VTAYSWILRQTIVDQTDLVQELLSTSGFFYGGMHENLVYFKCKTSSRRFDDKRELEKAIADSKRQITKLENELTELLKRKLNDTAITYQKEFRVSLSAKTNEIEEAENRLAEIEDVEEFMDTNYGWYLMQNEELHSLLGRLKFPTFKFSTQYWWGVPDEPNENLEEVIKRLKQTVIISNAKDAEIIKYLNRAFDIYRLRSGLSNEDEARVIPFWRQETTDPTIIADTSDDKWVNFSDPMPELNGSMEKPDYLKDLEL
jgi:hypothetical protein